MGGVLNRILIYDLQEHTFFAKLLIDLFHCRFDPAKAKSRKKQVAALEKALAGELDDVRDQSGHLVELRDDVAEQALPLGELTENFTG